MAQARERAALAIEHARQQAELAVARAEAEAARVVARAEAAAAQLLRVKERAARRLAEMEGLEHALVAGAEERAAVSAAEAEARAAVAIGERPVATAPPGHPAVPAASLPTRARARVRVRLPALRAARAPDVLLPVSLLLWVAGTLAVEPARVDDWGLLLVLPVIFYAALGLLVVSITWTLAGSPLSTVRLGLHLVALVVVLHGTMPLVFPQPIYPWVYKHIGVVGYIDLHGGLDASVDIYNNWPGFFALAAWFTKIAGVGSPVAYAEWAPAYFNLLTCLMLGFVLRSLPLTRRVKWLGLFLFVGGNWVGQDYFAPQALAFVLSLATIGMALAWFRAHRPPTVVLAAHRLVRRLTRTPGSAVGPSPAPPAGPAGRAAIAALFTVFGVVVFTHQLSPYLLLFGFGLLTVSGMMRPRWVVLGLGAMTIAYLVPRFPFLESRYQILDSLGPDDLIRALRHPLENIHSKGTGDIRPMPGRRMTALAAPGLILGLWALGAVGALRRVRAGRPTLILVLLAVAPAVLASGQNYGGEALFRIYLFSLPWTAVLAASAVSPRAGRWPLRTTVAAGGVLAVVLCLFMSAFYGSAELTQVRPGEIAASRFFGDHAPPGSVLAFVTPNFPDKVSARYDQFIPSAGEPTLLSAVPEFRHRMLGVGDVPAVTRHYEQYLEHNPGGVYLALSTGQGVWSAVLGLMPAGAVDNLDRALAQSAEWRVFFRNRDATIYRLLPR